MVFWLMGKVPVAFPVGMTLMNIMSLMSGFFYEGRFREGAGKFTLLYASTIPAALRGDLTPFFAVLCQPG